MAPAQGLQLIDERLKAAAALVFSEVNQHAGPGRWTEGILTVAYYPDFYDVVFRMERGPGKRKYISKSRELGIELTRLGDLRERLPDPWVAVVIGVRPDGDCRVKFHHRDQAMPDDIMELERMLSSGGVPNDIGELKQLLSGGGPADKPPAKAKAPRKKRT